MQKGLMSRNVARLIPVSPARLDAAGKRERGRTPPAIARLAVPLALLLMICAGGAAQDSSRPAEPPDQQANEESAQAQQGAADQAAQKQPVTRGEITVTARKTEELLQDVPVSVTAFTSDDFAKYIMSDIHEISIRTPGMSYGNFHDQKLSPLSLRGIVGNSGSAGADPAVSQYVDEVYIGQGAGAYLDLFDVERAEVLRGPQGLFFGRNSIGGAISYATQRPSSDFGAVFEGTYGADSYHRVGVLVNGALIHDKLAGKLSFISNGRDGTFNNLWLDRDVNTLGSWSGRGQLLWTPGIATQVTVTLEKHDVDQEALSFETLRYNDEAMFPQLMDALGLPRNNDPFDRDLYSDIEQPESLDLSGYSVHLTTPIGGGLLTSVTAYRDHDYSSIRDTDASGLRWLYDGDPETVERVSQELRALWTFPKSTFVVGAYFFDQTSNNQSFITVGEDLSLALLGEPLVVQAGSDAELATTSYAAFANFTFALSDRADMSAGLRYTVDEKDIDYVQEDPLGLLGGDATVKAGDEWSEATPAVDVRYRFSDAVRGYASVSRGFKSGGFNDALGSADGIAFGPEYLWNYELGLKTRLAGGRLIANFAAFYMDWSDIQIVVDNSATPSFDPIIANAGAAHSTGLEGEIMATPSEHWVLGVNFALTDAKYDNGTEPDGTPLDRIPYSPDYTANLSAEYTAALTGSISWFIGGEILSQGEKYLTGDNQPDGRVDPHSLVNARLGVRTADGRWRVTAWGKNVTDEVVKQRLFDLYDFPLIGQRFIEINNPVAYGLTFEFGF